MDKTYVIVAVRKGTEGCVVRVFGPYASEFLDEAATDLKHYFGEDWEFQRRVLLSPDDLPEMLKAAERSTQRLFFDAPRRPRAAADPMSDYHTPAGP